MEQEDAAADPYLPYDGGGDTIPLQEIPRRGTPHPLFPFSPASLRFPPLSVMTEAAVVLLLERVHVRIWQVEQTRPPLLLVMIWVYHYVWEHKQPPLQRLSPFTSLLMINQQRVLHVGLR